MSGHALKNLDRSLVPPYIYGLSQGIAATKIKHGPAIKAAYLKYAKAVTESSKALEKKPKKTGGKMFVMSLAPAKKRRKK